MVWRNRHEEPPTAAPSLKDVDGPPSAEAGESAVVCRGQMPMGDLGGGSRGIEGGRDSPKAQTRGPGGVGTPE